MSIKFIFNNFHSSPGTRQSDCSPMNCPSAAAPSQRMLKANGSKCVWLGSWEQSKDSGTSTDLLQLLESHQHGDHVPEGTRRSLPGA